MRLRPALLVILPLFGSLAYAGLLHAQGLHQIPVGPSPATLPAIPAVGRRGAPALLDAATRSLKFNAALKAAGLLGTPPQTLEMRVNPMNPRAAGGAEIYGAGAMFFSGPDASEPEGAYTFTNGSGMVSLPFVHMRFPTEPNKIYVIDCRLQAPPGAAKLSVLIGKPNGSGMLVPVESGHALSVVQATKSSTEVSLVVNPTPGASQQGTFYGCDFGKVQ